METVWKGGTHFERLSVLLQGHFLLSLMCIIDLSFCARTKGSSPRVGCAKTICGGSQASSSQPAVMTHVVQRI